MVCTDTPENLSSLGDINMDPTQPVWEIFVMILLLLIGVSYSIVYIMRYDDMVDGKTEGVTDGGNETAEQEVLL